MFQIGFIVFQAKRIVFVMGERRNGRRLVILRQGIELSCNGVYYYTLSNFAYI